MMTHHSSGRRDHPVGAPGPLTCRACGARTAATGAALCGTCLGVLGDNLDTVPAVLAELATARSRQDRLTHSPAGTVRGRPDPALGYRPASLDAHDRLAHTLTAWARRFGTDLGRVGVPDRDPIACAAWLAATLEEIRTHPAAPDVAHDVRAAVRIAWRVVDRPAPRTYAGPCDECGHDLYANPTAARLRCGECGTRYSVAERRATVLDALREHLATAAEISAGIGELYGAPLDRKRINQWHHRGLIVEHARTPDRRPVPLFRIGDVLDVAAAQVARSTRRRRPVDFTPTPEARKVVYKPDGMPTRPGHQPPREGTP